MIRVSNALHIITHLICTTTLEGRYYYSHNNFILHRANQKHEKASTIQITYLVNTGNEFKPTDLGSNSNLLLTINIQKGLPTNSCSVVIVSA